MTEENEDLAEFVASMNAEGVEYVIVGAYALAFHGHVRATKDLDILVRPAPKNIKRLLAALKSFGFGSLGLQEEDFRPGNIIQLGRPPNRVDLLTAIDGVDADLAWEERVMGRFLGQPAGYLSRELYLRNKKAAGRPQDLVDIQKLEP